MILCPVYEEGWDSAGWYRRPIAGSAEAHELPFDLPLEELAMLERICEPEPERRALPPARTPASTDYVVDQGGRRVLTDEAKRRQFEASLAELERTDPALARQLARVVGRPPR